VHSDDYRNDSHRCLVRPTHREEGVENFLQEKQWTRWHVRAAQENANAKFLLCGRILSGVASYVYHFHHEPHSQQLLVLHGGGHSSWSITRHLQRYHLLPAEEQSFEIHVQCKAILLEV
jgi:hypothetical protein